MTPLKDTLEANPAGETAVTQANEQSKPAQGLRSDAVSLDVPVKVHGSRVTDVVRGITSHTEPFEEETATMIVFPQGGVLKMSTSVTVGQMVVLTNLKSGHDAICRIVKVRAYAQTQSYVEIEFTNRQPGYWGVYFAADAADIVQKAARPAASAAPPAAANAAPPAVQPTASNITPPVASNTAGPVARKLDVERAVEAEKPRDADAFSTLAPAPPARAAKPSQPVSTSDAPSAKVERASQTNKPASSFVSIGAQEDVQLPASETSSKKPSRAVATSAPSLSMADLQGDGPLAPPASSMSSLSSGVPGEMVDLPLDEVEDESAPLDQPATFGRLAASASAASSHSAPQAAFGSRFDSGALGVPAQESEPRSESNKSGLLIVLGVAAVIALAAGGSFYFHAWPFAPSSTTAGPAVAAPAVQTTASQNSASTPASAQTDRLNPVLAVKAPAPRPETQSAVRAKPSKPAVVEEAAPVQAAAAAPAPAPEPPASPKEVPNMFGVLNAHPSSSAHANSGQVTAAPSLEPGAASGNENGALQAIGTPAALPPPLPGTSPSGGLRTGGDIREPRLIHSVLPIYPSVAKTAGVEGNVVVDTSIDTGGNVTDVKVVSGPILLRQAALNALTHWKYEPATLNGNPVPVQFRVTIQFHR